MFKLKDFRREYSNKKPIKEEDLKTLVSLREEELDLATKLEVVRGFRERKEMELFSAIKSGVETGHLDWKIQIRKIYRVYPAWKVLFIEELGIKKAEEVTNKTRKTSYIDIVLEKF